MGTGKNIILFILGAILGFGIGFYLGEELLPFLKFEERIGVSIVLTFAAYSALYFMTKGN